MKESLEEMGPFFEVGCKQTSTCLEQVIFVPVTGLLKTIGFCKKAFFLCGDVGFELLNIPMKYTDGQHLDNQLAWF